MAKTKKLPHGRLKISELPNNQPAWAPLYPPMPYKMFGGKAIIVNYETDMDAVLDILPPELTPMTDPPIVSAYLNGGYEFATGGRLSPNDFEGGKTGAVKILGKLGFAVQPIEPTDS